MKSNNPYMNVQIEDDDDDNMSGKFQLTKSRQKGSPKLEPLSAGGGYQRFQSHQRAVQKSVDIDRRNMPNI